MLNVNFTLALINILIKMRDVCQCFYFKKYPYLYFFISKNTPHDLFILFDINLLISINQYEIFIINLLSN